MIVDWLLPLEAMIGDEALTVDCPAETVLAVTLKRDEAAPAAATVVVPDSAPPPGLLPSATVTFAVNWVAVFPCASCAVTCTAGVIAVPAVVLDGWTLNTSCDATPGVISNGVLVPVGRPVAAAVRVYPLPVLFTLKPGKEATPPTAATVAVPPSVPPPGLAPSATVTLPVNAVAVLPCGSCAVTWTAGVMTAAAVVVVGSTVKTSWLAVPGVTLNAVLLAVVSPVATAVSV